MTRPFNESLTQNHDVFLRFTNCSNALMAVALASKWLAGRTALIATVVMVSLNVVALIFSIYTMKLRAIWAKISEIVLKVSHNV